MNMPGRSTSGFSGVKPAIKMSKVRKAPNEDNMYAEMLELLDNESFKRLTHLLNKVDCSKILPPDWC